MYGLHGAGDVGLSRELISRLPRFNVLRYGAILIVRESTKF
jgi:hypothetical protein